MTTTKLKNITNSLLEGAASLYLFPSYIEDQSKEELKANSPNRIRKHWEAVGKHLWVAINEFERQNEK